MRSTKVGRVRTCTLDSEVLSAAEQWLHDRRTTWARRLDRLSVALDTSHANPPHQEQP